MERSFRAAGITLNGVGSGGVVAAGTHALAGLFVSAALAMLALPACGGRVARPVAESSATDAVLTCDHIVAEFRVNLARMDDLAGEREGKVNDNIGWLLIYPVFIDLSVAEQTEIEALLARNRRLIELAGEKACRPMRGMQTGPSSGAPVP